jgi:hypothetical protein
MDFILFRSVDSYMMSFSSFPHACGLLSFWCVLVWREQMSCIFVWFDFGSWCWYE